MAQKLEHASVGKLTVQQLSCRRVSNKRAATVQAADGTVPASAREERTPFAGFVAASELLRVLSVGNDTRMANEEDRDAARR
jgi:hypothetical protein